MPSNDNLHSNPTLDQKRLSPHLLTQKKHVSNLIRLLLFSCHGCSQLISFSMCCNICTCELTDTPGVLYVQLGLYEYYMFGKRVCHMLAGRHGSKLWVYLSPEAKSQD